MRPELFYIPGVDFPINSYGVVLIVGFLLALECGKFLARRAGHDPEVYVNAGIIALVSGVIGARLSHVIENWPQYSDPARTFAPNFFDATHLRSGALTSYGLLLLPSRVPTVAALLMKAPVGRGMEVVAACITIGLGLGRMGS